ncbi:MULTISPECIES: hypothetical protein [Bacillaceae]|uniref:hypothetical protein n=1 Tax=Bacillaceae TaxID=186817 RepID=UPI00159BBE07|nr:MULTISPECIES: hypothetical protein [Bacillaceae]UGB31691.1 hypothetical protein LPC09_04205 [Metabacillus sp. B2-18]
MNKDYIFFCQNCGLPQRITNYVIKKYFISYGVKGFYCSNCCAYNKFTDEEKQVLLND